MDNRPIGIFDSGLGGLNGLRALRRFLPDENIVYFADSGRLPYGAKSRPQLRGMAKQDLRFLSSFERNSLLQCGGYSRRMAEPHGWCAHIFRRLDAPPGRLRSHRGHRHRGEHPQRQLSVCSARSVPDPRSRRDSLSGFCSTHRERSLFG